MAYCLHYAECFCTDLEYIDSVLAEVWDTEYDHPAVNALENKREALGAYLAGQKQKREVLTGRADPGMVSFVKRTEPSGGNAFIAYR